MVPSSLESSAGLSSPTLEIALRCRRGHIAVLRGDRVSAASAVAAVEQWADVPVHDRFGRVVGQAGDWLPILAALNGVAGEDIALRYFDRVFAVCVWFPTVMIEPGEVIVRTAAPRGVFHHRTQLGGPDAPLAPRQSIPAVVDVLEAQAGAPGLQFLDRHGAPVPR